jgi:hypothetical protein
MAKIWKVTYKHTYGPQNQYSYTDTKFYYTEKEMLKILKKLTDTEGTIEVFESDKQKLSIDGYLDSLKREVQLGSLLEVADEKSVLHSKFIEIFSKSKVGKSTKNGILKEWDFLPKTDDAELKKFFAKYRNQFLLGVTDTIEWYRTLLDIYNYAMITDHAEIDYRYDSRKGQYVKSLKVITPVTETQVASFVAAKDQIKKEKTLAKKLAKKNEA